MQENGIKAALRAGRVAIGTDITELATRGLPKMLEYAGLDFVMIDMEHTGYSLETIGDLIGWFKATPITVLVRPPDNLYHWLAGVMDMGAMGVMVANIRSAADARAVVDAVMYPPLGNRGVSLNGPHTDFSNPRAADYMPARNAQTSVVAMIESMAGLDNVDEIAATEGVDMLHPSRNDLSVALGVPNDYSHPKYKSALARVAEACKRHNKALKSTPQGDDEVLELYDLGCRVMGVGTAALMFQRTMKSGCDHLRSVTAALG